MVKKIFVITGEASGDILAFNVFKNLHKKKNLKISGILGEKLKKLSIRNIFSNHEITFFGISEILLNIFSIKKKIEKTVKYIERFKPDIVFSVDSPDFVLQVINEIKKNNKIKTKFYHYVAPTIWAWREDRLIKIKKSFDKIYLLFDFEKKYFDKFNIASKFVGHPFFEKFKPNLNASVNNKLISFCPGSRKSELKKFLPIFKKVIILLGKDYEYHLAINKNHYSYVKDFFNGFKYKLIINYDSEKKFHYFKKSLLSVAKSGTISLDLCKAQLPIITVYKFDTLTYFFVKFLVKVKYGNIINIMAKKMLIPELIQRNCTPTKIVNKINYYVNSKSERLKMVNNYNKVLRRISNKKTSLNIAKDLLANI
jgi:lipid-A-disaccharide synthase